MTEWFIYQPGGNHIGPVTTELVARGVQAGKVPKDAYVAIQSGGGWVPISSVPEIMAAIAAQPEKKTEPPLRHRRVIPFGVFGVFLLFTLIAIVVSMLAARPAHADEGEPPPEKHAPTTMHVGLTLVGLSKFELGPGTYNADVIVSVKCDDDPCNPDLDVANGRITGKEKLVDEKRHKVFKLKTELAGLVDLGEFPFDEHVLPLELEDKSDPTGVVFVLDESTTTIAPDVKLAGWELTHWGAQIEKEDIGGGESISQIQFGLAITRPRVAGFFKSLMPVFFMVFVALFSLLLKPKSAAGRLSTATGGLMSVVMFHVSATSALPPLGYLTRMDKFMIATYAIYVVNIAFTVAMVRFDEKKRERAADLAYLVSAGLVPGLALLLWVVVFTRLV